MIPPDFIAALHRRTSVTTIGPSTLRGQETGVLMATQAFLADMNLNRIPGSSKVRYRTWLDQQTEGMLDSLPGRYRPWGAARKALNLFLRDLLYNQYLHDYYGIGRLEPWLELPLDSIVARALRHDAGRGKLPHWPGLRHLTLDIHERYQTQATHLAKQRGLARVHLDIELWTEGRPAAEKKSR